MVTNIHSRHQRKALSTKDRILRWPEVQERAGICRSHAHKLAAQGDFPKPIKLGVRSSGWVESEIEAWLENRIAQSRLNSEAV